MNSWRVKLSVHQLAEFALHLCRARGMTLDDLCRMGRARFVQAHIDARGDDADWLFVVRPSVEEIEAMYDELLLLWASELTTTSSAVN